MACLYGIVNGGHGLFSLFFGGSRYIARMVFEGDLDMMLVKPKNLLMQIMGAKSVSSGWGDVASCLFFLGISGYATLQNIPILILLIAASSIVINSFSIVTGSLAFWLGDSHALSKQLFEFLLTFSNYPKSIYVGALKVVLLTVVPSAFIGFIPVETVKNHSLSGMCFVLTFASVYSYCAAKFFYYGLKRYSSGNKPGFRV
jgi:ABC-2 type transport system permease protein